MAVGDAVEAHGGEARGGEGDGDPENVEELYIFDITGDRNPNQRKGQREQRMRQLHEVGVAHEARRAAERLPLTPRGRDGGAHFFTAIGAPIPSFSHIASTRDFVAASISITGGHSRVKPSSGHFFVASMPIFDPYVNARLE